MRLVECGFSISISTVDQGMPDILKELKKWFSDYVCDCGAKISVLLSGQILTIYRKNGKISYWGMLPHPSSLRKRGSSNSKFVSDFNINTTKTISNRDICSL